MYVKFREEKFGGVIFETLRERVFTVNETGALIMRLIKEGKIRSEVAETLSKGYPGQESQVERDVAGFFAFLGKEDLLQ